MADLEEASLEREVERNRAVLVARANALQKSTRELLDPLERVRRHPIRGILLSFGIGFALTALARHRGVNGAAAMDGGPLRSEHPIARLARTFAPDLFGGLLAPLLTSVLSGGRTDSRRAGRKGLFRSS